MDINRDEFLLLSRRGSVPRSSGAGPPRPFGEADAGSHRRRWPAGIRAGRTARTRLRRVVAAARGGGRSAAPDPGAITSWPVAATGSRPAGAPRPVPARGYADREAYLELEFAVGFGADDEPWL